MIEDDSVLQLNSVEYYFRSGFFLKKKPILRSVTIGVKRGTITSLVGPNGAGKTTTIKLCSGLIKPDSGYVLLFDNQAHLPINRGRIGVVTETQYAYPFLRLKEWLKMLCGLSGFKGHELTDAVDRSLELLDLSDLSGNYMKNLSKGQLQRAGIAQALMHNPDILLLDEPMSGLDPFWRYKVNMLIREFKEQGGTVLFSSHILSDVESLSDQVVLMQRGQVRWSGSLGELDRQTLGYEVIGKIHDMNAMNTIFPPNILNDYPGGLSIFPIEVKRKKDLMRLVAQGSFVLESITPIQDEIEDILFRL
ncbi:hypothetical protein DSLASN_02850 [Desulfoluna limicola]|uniref:ABC transporter domain-containing protein n=1 Tax=Desulfoluna limicola TaxID=2810562 RepID=A0ABN6EYC8_9BACT|nr:ABC transporter ATP-binding protein [Desulfoluna limicola]BCS94653.1 hypothetical protein DSLASN_02850 [Desulfoluna limicola]